MMKRLQLLLLATLVMCAFRVVTQTQTIVVVPANASADFTVSHVIGTYGPIPSATLNATTNYARFDVGSFQAGASVRIGTCGMAEASFERNTFLRLFIANTTTELAWND